MLQTPGDRPASKQIGRRVGEQSVAQAEFAGSRGYSNVAIDEYTVAYHMA